MVLCPLSCKFCKVWASTSKVIKEISVKFVSVFQYIYSFRRQFRRHFSNRFLCNFAGTIGWNYGNCPINLAEFDRVLQKLLMQSTEPTLWQRRRSVFRWYLSQFSTVSHVILHTPFAAIAATALKIWWGLIEYSKSYWCDALKQHCFHVARALKMRAVIETALRKCPPSYMCDWAVRTDKGRSPGLRE